MFPLGHKALFDRGVLHRDISIENILFGPHDAPDGCRGILIDLDIAVRTEEGVSPLPPSSLTVGVRNARAIRPCAHPSIGNTFLPIRLDPSSARAGPGTSAGILGRPRVHFLRPESPRLSVYEARSTTLSNSGHLTRLARRARFLCRRTEIGVISVFNSARIYPALLGPHVPNAFGGISGRHCSCHETEGSCPRRCGYDKG